MLISAAAQAQKAVDLILGVKAETETQKEIEAVAWAAALKKEIKVKNDKLLNRLTELRDETLKRLRFLQSWYLENPNQTNEMLLHALDGRLETLEQLINEVQVS